MTTPIPTEFDEQTTPQSNETPLDVNLLKEIARKALVDALNSVRPFETSSTISPTLGVL
jgi:hypothetical protein